MPVTEAGLGATKAFPADALAGYALSVDLAVPAGAAPPDYALAAGRRPVAAEAQADIPPFFAAVAALSLHLTTIALVIILTLLGPLLEPLLGPSRQLGTEDGLPENVNVSVISQAELDRLHSSAARQDQSARPGPLGPAETPPTATQAVPAPPQPAAQEADAAPSSPQPKADARRDSSFDLSAFLAEMYAQSNAQQKHNRDVAEAEARRRTAARPKSVASGRVRSTRPGATHLGKSDEFERDVIWALGATVPEGNGTWGITEVTFTVSAAGQPDGLRLIKSSGDNWLDTAALMAVKQARIPSPPPGLPAGDRTFIIDYISLPSRGR